MFGSRSALLCAGARCRFLVQKQAPLISVAMVSFKNISFGDLLPALYLHQAIPTSSEI